MNSKDIRQRFEEINKDNKIICTNEELENFILSGLILQSGKKYITKNNKKLNISILENPEYNLNIDLRKLIKYCEDQSKENKIKRVYCMSKKLYNIYKSQGLIITKDSKDYYRLYESELWLVCIL